MKPYVGSMWRRLAEAFSGERVRLVLGRRTVEVGRVVEIAAEHFVLEDANGRRRRIAYADLSSMEKTDA